MPKKHPPLLDPPLLERPPEEPLLEPVYPLDEEPPPVLLPPVHEPALHVCPLKMQLLQTAPPVPHALSDPDVSQEPLRSQQPVQLLGSHVEPGTDASSIAPLEELVPPLFPELLEDCAPYELPAPESSPLPLPLDPPGLGALEPPAAPGVANVA